MYISEICVLSFLITYNQICSICICADAHTCDEPKSANNTCQNLFVLRLQESISNAVCSSMLVLWILEYIS